jgi:acylphosphatase
MTVERWQLRVSGKVQGVSYRAYTEQKAGELGLTGTVKNLPGGDVEIIAEGTPDDLEALQDWCRNGPPLAMVENVSTETQAPTGEFNDFRVVY